MLQVLQIVALLLIAVAMATALAHALEFPGKRRLDREAYVTVQAIYYPGFTMAGLIGEFGGIVVLVLLGIVTPYGSMESWWTIAALALMLAMHATYWLMTHPVNNFWLRDTALSAPAGRFFLLFSTARRSDDWRSLRDTWEYSHVVRAGFSILALLAIAVVVAL